ncbi:Ger(x)C family spore germination protein [Lysinibacillus fusiformis]|uniref:Ger(x)C family spore germination protein n=1 Tax=Lysinibacillus fusiformis TaxID=28031 RepID=UPI0019675988|nr:Ger(x)C family spore germination protein [Lysinibacillus fusiformis]QSB09395.1 Ger(x)C family spore germination protein [Lysinibacillus fusiformis]
MFRKGSIIILSIVLVAGCWDERLYKNASVVTLVGVEGYVGDYKGYYAYPNTTTQQNEVIEADGISPRDVRTNANLKVEQTLDLSELSTILIADYTVRKPIYDVLDIYFRDPKNPISIKVAITEGDVKPYIDLTKDLAGSAGSYYERFIESTEENTFFPKLDLQTIGSMLFEQTVDIVLPYFQLSEDKQHAVVAGLALFSGQTFTGTVLTPKQSLIMLILMNQSNKQARMSYMWKHDGKEMPITANVIHIKRKWAVNEELRRITMDYQVEVEIEEFAQDHLYKDPIFKDVQQMIQEHVQAEFEEVIRILQNQKSDTLGIGRYIRAYHPKMFKEDWHAEYASLQLVPSVQVKIIRTGVLR